MAECNKKLWKILIDKGMRKKDLCIAAGISSASITKMDRGGTVNASIFEKTCNVLNCDIGDIMEITTKDLHKGVQ